jgi:hypothetical protein
MPFWAACLIAFPGGLVVAGIPVVTVYGWPWQWKSEQRGTR